MHTQVRNNTNFFLTEPSIEKNIILIRRLKTDLWRLNLENNCEVKWEEWREEGGAHVDPEITRHQTYLALYRE